MPLCHRCRLGHADFDQGLDHLALSMNTRQNLWFLYRILPRTCSDLVVVKYPAPGCHRCQEKAQGTELKEEGEDPDKGKADEQQLHRQK